MRINWTIVFWIAAIILFGWLVAKQLGYINTPILIEILPYLSGFIALIALAKKGGSSLQKLEHVVSDVKDMKKEIKEIRNTLHSLDKRISFIEYEL